MRLRHHFNTGTENVVRGDLWTDENGVVQFTPPELRDVWEPMIVDSWPEHPGEYLHIDAGKEWLRGLLWMSDMGRFGSGRTWLTVVEDERAAPPLPSGDTFLPVFVEGSLLVVEGLRPNVTRHDPRRKPAPDA